MYNAFFFLNLVCLFVCSQTGVSVENQTENILDDVVEEFKEGTVKPKVKKKKKQKEGDMPSQCHHY